MPRKQNKQELKNKKKIEGKINLGSSNSIKFLRVEERQKYLNKKHTPNLWES